MSDLFVIDEWIWEPEVLEKHKEQIFQFLSKVYEKCDRVVVVENSPFVTKFHKVCKSQDRVVRNIIKLFKNMFLYNSQKCVKYDETDLPSLPEDIAKAVKEDDHYLIRAYITAQASILITTDSSLIEIVSKYSVCCKQMHEYMKE